MDICALIGLQIKYGVVVHIKTCLMIDPFLALFQEVCWRVAVKGYYGVWKGFNYRWTLLRISWP